MRMCGVEGRLIINADDWGRSADTTNTIRECVRQRRISSVSAMVFMQDSLRASEIANEDQIDAGLHLNLTTAFDNASPSRLRTHQERISRFLQRFRWSQAIFHFGLSQSFEYVVSAQIDEFARIYGSIPKRIDGHHHMHLCANVVLGQLIPKATVVRRSFTFDLSEKGATNVIYRRALNSILSRRYYLADFFFSLSDLMRSNRIDQAFALAKNNVVEIETHPVNAPEYAFLESNPLVSEYRIADSYVRQLSLVSR